MKRKFIRSGDINITNEKDDDEDINLDTDQLDGGDDDPLDFGSLNEDGEGDVDEGFMEEANSIDEFGSNSPTLSKEEVIDAVQAVDEIINIILATEGVAEGEQPTSEEVNFVLDEVQDLAAGFDSAPPDSDTEDFGASTELPADTESMGEFDEAGFDEGVEEEFPEEIEASLVRVMVAGKPIKSKFSKPYVSNEVFSGVSALLCSGIGTIPDMDEEEEPNKDTICESVAISTGSSATPIQEKYVRVGSFKKWVMQSKDHKLAWKIASAKYRKLLGQSAKTPREKAVVFFLANNFYNKVLKSSAKKVFKLFSGRSVKAIRKVDRAFQNRFTSGKPLRVLYSDYNGYKNFDTWNVSLYIQNDDAIYNKAKRLASSGVTDYDQFINQTGLAGKKTPDNVAWNSAKIDRGEMSEVLSGLVSSINRGGMGRKPIKALNIRSNLLGGEILSDVPYEDQRVVRDIQDDFLSGKIGVSKARQQLVNTLGQRDSDIDDLIEFWIDEKRGGLTNSFGGGMKNRRGVSSGRNSGDDTRDGYCPGCGAKLNYCDLGTGIGFVEQCPSCGYEDFPNDEEITRSRIAKDPSVNLNRKWHTDRIMRASSLNKQGIRSATQVDRQGELNTVQDDTYPGPSFSNETLSDSDIEDGNPTRVQRVNLGDTSETLDVDNTGDDGSLVADIDAGTPNNESEYGFDSREMVGAELPIEGDDNTQVLELKHIGSGVYVLNRSFISQGAGRLSFCKGDQAVSLFSKAMKPAPINPKCNLNRTITLGQSKTGVVLKSSSILGVIAVEAPCWKGLKNSKYSVFSRVGNNLINDEGYFFTKVKGTQRVIASAASHKAVRKGLVRKDIFSEVESAYVKSLRNKVHSLRKLNASLTERLDSLSKVQKRQQVLNSQLLNKERRSAREQVASAMQNLNDIKRDTATAEGQRVIASSQNALREHLLDEKAKNDAAVDHLAKMMRWV